MSEAFISSVYAILLGFLGFYAMMDFIKSTRKKTGGDAGGGHDAHGGPSGLTPFAVSLQKINIPPMISFDEDFGGRKISWLFVAIGGLIVGALAAIMGVGGGFVTFPMFVYVIRRINSNNRRYGYPADHLYCRACGHRSVCYLRLCLLHACDGHAPWVPDRHSGWCAYHKGC